MVRSITGKDINCKYEMLECKGEANRQPGFSRGIGSLTTTTNPRCGTQVTKTRVAATSQVIKTRALTRSLRSPSLAWWSSNHVQGHQDLFRASTTTWQAPKVTPITKIVYVLPTTKSNKPWPSLEQDPNT
jgi:hypothetical protein